MKSAKRTGAKRVKTRDPIAAEVPLQARQHPQPAWISPMLATLAAKAFSNDDWIFESKLDGVRCLVARQNNQVHLYSRNRKQLNQAYPELLPPLTAQPAQSYIADGEVVAFQDGVTSFSLLQRRMQVRDPDQALRRGVKVFYYLFDLLYWNGYDLRNAPLLERKNLLHRTFHFRGPLRFSSHRRRDGEAFFEEACRQGLEGLIAKRASSVYVSTRSRDWLKFKYSAQQEFVIIGYTDPKGARESFGALLVGYYDDGRLLNAGKVGTGFDTETLRQLGRELASLHVEHSRTVHWVQPKLVAQVAFTEWTRDGKLRHPRFLGLRRDKPPRQVVRERPK